MSSPTSNMFCVVCGIVDEDYDENAQIMHFATVKHICNQKLFEYKSSKKSLRKNRDSIFIKGCAEAFEKDGIKSLGKSEMTHHYKIIVHIKPRQSAKFIFDIYNECKEDLMIEGVQLAHPQPQFTINKHPYIFGEPPLVWMKKTSLPKAIYVVFDSADIGQYEMPIMFKFKKKTKSEIPNKDPLIFVRELVVVVEENPIISGYPKSPYTKEALDRALCKVPSTNEAYPQQYLIPHYLKIILPRGLDEGVLENLQMPNEEINKLRTILVGVRAVFDEGLTVENYMAFFHHLLWWEEIIVKINLRKYNMSGVTLQYLNPFYALEVPGLVEKRPSLLRGDKVFLQSHTDKSYLFESVIKKIDENFVHLGEIDKSFHAYYGPDVLFDVRFIMSRVPFERSHDAVSKVYSSKQGCRVFPEPRRGTVRVTTITKFFNPIIKGNEEQRSAVEHIVAGTSGKAPYIVFGPPGTGKTMTIVEAIVQLVVRNPRNRILVCTDSNMAADHIAVTLLKFNKSLNIDKFLLRANSQNREWTIMPPELRPHSNGTSYENFNSLDNACVSTYRIVVTTLLHAAKYALPNNQRKFSLKMSHLFVDEAAQASEPHTLVPIAGLLTPTGQLVLAGDPKQLGPVCISKEASSRGLGISLLERLLLSYSNLYEKDPDYMTMLVKNFRSDPDILKLPNELFYKNELVAFAPKDPLSQTAVLSDLPGGQSAIVFHAVNSKEQRIRNAPSYFNEKELEMLRRYVVALVVKHGVRLEDIGIIAPYIRQVYKMKSWLTSQNYEKIDVGTVEAFQGKEKRVILVSTVRANCRLLDYDAKYALGFLVDDKRFNVTITRAKAKIVIIGNPTCLIRDLKWRMYMDLCKEARSYFGQDDQQVERNADLLTEIAVNRFNLCGISKILDDAIKEKQEGQKQKGSKKRHKNKSLMV